MRTEPDPTWRMLCADAITSQISALMDESEGVLARKDVESVHRMRVASRRVRAALDTFEDCLPSDRANVWRKEVKRITGALGTARDADVQIEFLKDILPSAGPKETPGINAILARKTRERAELQAPLAKALRGLEERGAMAQMLKYFQGEREIALKQGSPPRSPMAYENAWEQVHVKVEELLAHEPCVHKEGAVKDHHAMRISAKRLRYALEMIRPLFDDGLEEEIGQIKRLQELLGDLHDCDVWIQDLGRIVGTLDRGGLELSGGLSAKKVEPGLEYLRRDRAKHRKEIYAGFVDLWDSWAERGFVESLSKRLESSAEQTEDLSPKAVEMLVSDPGMKVAVIGDVHGNLQALKAVLKDAERHGAKAVLNTGDLLGYGASPEEAARLLRSRPSVSIIGNYDLKVFRIHDRKELWPQDKSEDKLLSFIWAYDHVSPSTRAWLRSLPKEVRMDVGGLKLLMVHGSPDSMDEHLGPDTPARRLEDIAKAAGVDLIIMGHSHKSMNRTACGTRFINPGSVGRPDDGDPRASYALLRLRPFQVSLHRIDYDVKGTVRAIREASLPEEFAKMVMEGRAYDQVVGKRQGEGMGRRAALERVWKVARSYLGQDPHTDQVHKLSVVLFECLSKRMELGKEDRYWLECAAILHDIGWTEGRKGHHKASLRIILEEDALPFDRDERREIGCIARYHRKALPSSSHAHFSNLGRKDRRRVIALSAILRVADALDCSHDVKVRSLRCQLTPDKLILHCATAGSLDMEQREALKKGDLLRKVAGLDLELRKEVEP